MYEQAIVILSIVYFVFGSLSGLITSIFTKSKIKKVGGAFIGGVSAAVAGLVVVVTITDIQSKIGNTQSSVGGISLNELLPSLIASMVAAIFLVYVIGLVAGENKT